MTWYKTKPKQKQIEALAKAKGQEAFALFLEMGCGKSKIVIDESSILFTRGEIQAVLILCPNGGQTNWVNREIATHCAVKYKAAYKYNGWTAKERDRWLDTIAASPDHLRFFVINIDQLSVKSGRKTMVDILTLWPTYMAIDESHRIKSESADRTKQAIKLAPLAKKRRILSGTASPQSPLDLYSQFYFLNPRIFGHSIFATFRAEYAHQRKQALAAKYQPKDADGNTLSKRFYWQILGYKNEQKLKALMAPYTFSCRLTEVTDMPPLIFNEIECELTDEQRRMYDELVTHSAASITACPTNIIDPKDRLRWLIYNADIVPQNQLTELLRLQQLLGGHVDEHVVPSNRLKTLLDHLEDIDGKVIIWVRFIPELLEIAKALGPAAVTYYGDTSTADRTAAVDSFQDPNSSIKYFVGQTATAGIMLTLTASHHIVHYSMSFKADDYIQANFRAWRMGQTNSVTVSNILTKDTIDKDTLKSVKQKAARMEKLLYE